MNFNFSIPAGVWGAMSIITLILVSHLGLSIYNRFFPKIKAAPTNEAVGIVFGVLTLIYSLLVAFVIVAVWEDYERLKVTVENEADEINSVMVHSNLLPDSLRKPVEKALDHYCRKVINEEWNVVDGNTLGRPSDILTLRLMLFKWQAKDGLNDNLLSAMDNNLNNISNYRRERLSHTRSYVPDLVWDLLLIGSMMVIMFSYFLNVESLLLKRIYLSFLWGIIGNSLFLIYMLDRPFIGSTQVSNVPFKVMINALENRNRFLLRNN